jgi:hypothetical protein
MLKDRWIAALRSGTYQQTYMQMHDGENSFCALGVLLHVIDPIWGQVTKRSPSGKSYTYWAWLGSGPDLDTIIERMGIDGSKIFLANDQYDYSFNRIARMIESGAMDVNRPDAAKIEHYVHDEVVTLDLSKSYLSADDLKKYMPIKTNPCSELVL